MTSVERAFPALLQDFFRQRLVAQRGASAHTIASYRDTFTLFLGYAAERTGRTPSALTLEDLDAPMVLDFLDHLETERGNFRAHAQPPSHRHPVLHALRFAARANPAARRATRLQVTDVLLDRASSLLLHGKGRKERRVSRR